MNISKIQAIRFIGDGSLDFQVHQRDQNIASISANIITQQSPITRVFQPLDLINISRDDQGRIVIGIAGINHLINPRATFVFQGITYPLTINRSNQGDNRSSVTLPVEVSTVSGVGDLNITTNDAIYSAKIVTEPPPSFLCDIGDISEDGDILTIEVEPAVDVTIYDNNNNQQLGQQFSNALGRVKFNTSTWNTNTIRIYVAQIDGFCANTMNYTLQS